MVHVVIRNIPNSEPKLEAAKKLRIPGHTMRKRGRGARAAPPAFRDRWGYKRREGGEYQDLPMEKASRFNAYISPTRGLWKPWMYFDYVGVTEDGRLRVRVTPK